METKTAAGLIYIKGSGLAVDYCSTATPITSWREDRQYWVEVL